LTTEVGPDVAKNGFFRHHNGGTFLSPATMLPGHTALRAIEGQQG
jgi:hypothetical protein